MITITEIFKPDQETPDGQPFYSDDLLAKMQQRIASAYAAFAEGRASKEDADLVIVDLAVFTRYLDTTQLGTSNEVLRELNGRRAVFARIVEAVIGAGGKLDDLHRAVLATPALSEES